MNSYEVAEPILDSPFEEPGRHWYIRSGEQPELRDGRRPAETPRPHGVRPSFATIKFQWESDSTTTLQRQAVDERLHRCYNLVLKNMGWGGRTVSMASPEEIEHCKASIVQRLGPCEIALQGTEATEHAPGSTFQHDCYRASLDYLIDAGERPGLSLVHGKIQPSETDHAWIEFEEQDAVYDSTLLRFYRRPCYYAVRGAKSVRKYSYFEALRLYTDAGHYGPWHSMQTCEKTGKA